MRFPQVTTKGRSLVLVAVEVSQSSPLFTHEFLLLTSVLNTNIGLPGLVEDLEREVLDVILHFEGIKLAANEMLGVEDTEIRYSNIVVTDKRV